MTPTSARILLLAGDTTQSGLLTDALKSIGHFVIREHVPDNAFSRIEESSVNLIIADVAFIESASSGFYNRLKERFPALPVILITENGDTGEPTALSVNQPNGRISIPFRIEHIENLIENLLNSGSPGKSIASGDTILIVDDDDAFRTMLIRSLQLSGYKTIGASDGAEALEVIERGGIGTVIADIYMPAMDGISLLRKIRARWPRIRVILITGYFSDSDQIGTDDEKPDGFLMKPFQIESIDKLLKDILSKKRQS